RASQPEARANEKGRLSQLGKTAANSRRANRGSGLLGLFLLLFSLGRVGLGRVGLGLVSLGGIGLGLVGLGRVGLGLVSLGGIGLGLIGLGLVLLALVSALGRRRNCGGAARIASRRRRVGRRSFLLVAAADQCQGQGQSRKQRPSLVGELHRITPSV